MSYGYENKNSQKAITWSGAYSIDKNNPNKSKYLEDKIIQIPNFIENYSNKYSTFCRGLVR